MHVLQELLWEIVVARSVVIGSLTPNLTLSSGPSNSKTSALSYVQIQWNLFKIARKVNISKFVFILGD